MKLKSKLKEIFTDEVLRLVAALCDTRRIASNQQKMKLLCELFHTYKINFEILGGATNRVAMFISGYAIKVAIDAQGYVDNLMEFALSEELQPYVTKSYETNGYILVAECVRTMTLDEFRQRRLEISKILDVIGQEYLLGDVGLKEKNFTNWGIRDNNSCVILDYAYVHRGNEKLFTCEVCGVGTLVYDSTYTQLRCSNRTVCRAHFSYTERRKILGDEGDALMMNEAKNNAIVINENETFKEVDVLDNGILQSSDVFIIHNLEDYYKYERMMEMAIIKKYKKEREMRDFMSDVMDSDVDRVVTFQAEDGSTEQLEYEIPSFKIESDCEDDIYVGDDGYPHVRYHEEEEKVFIDSEDGAFTSDYSLSDLAAEIRSKYGMNDDEDDDEEDYDPAISSIGPSGIDYSKVVVDDDDVDENENSLRGLGKLIRLKYAEKEKLAQEAARKISSSDDEPLKYSFNKKKNENKKPPKKEKDVSSVVISQSSTSQPDTALPEATTSGNGERRNVATSNNRHNGKHNKKKRNDNDRQLTLSALNCNNKSYGKTGEPKIEPPIETESTTMSVDQEQDVEIKVEPFEPKVNDNTDDADTRIFVHGVPLSQYLGG